MKLRRNDKKSRKWRVDIVIDADWPFGAGKIQNDLTNVSHPNNSLKGLKGISSNAALSSRNVYK